MAKLTKQTIVEAAFVLLQEHGLSAITARGLAERLGVRAGALYYHLPDMSALADEMATVMMREIIADVAPPGDWPGMLRFTARHLREVLLRYRDGARLFSGTYLTDDEAIGSMEEPLRRLTDASFEMDDALRVLQTMTAYVIGFVIEEQHRLAAPERYTVERRRQRIDTVRFPLTAAVNETFVGAADETFEWGVAVFVEGIASRVARRQAP